MSISRAWYVTCDLCGSPIGGNAALSVESAAEARRLAKGAGAKRRRVLGKMADLCESCAPSPVEPLDREQSK